MGADHKLNQAFLYGSLIIDVIVGLAMKSWFVFWVIAILVFGGGLYAGNSRIDRWS